MKLIIQICTYRTPFNDWKTKSRICAIIDQDQRAMSNSKSGCDGMSVLVAAMDISEDMYNEYAYLGIVIGLKENIDAMIRRLDLQKFSRASIKSSDVRNRLARQLNFNNRENIAFCIKIDKPRIIKKTKESIRKKRTNNQLTKVFPAFNHHLLSLIEDIILTFVQKHRTELGHVVFECDGDCRNFLKDNGLRHDGPKYVHVLADIIAWANNRGIEPRGVIFLDLSKKIEKRMDHDF